MLSTLLVVGVISHLWCAARLVGIAHHSFYSVVMLAQYAYSKRSLLKKFWQKLPMNTNIHVLGRKCDNEEILLSFQESRDMDLSTSYKKE